METNYYKPDELVKYGYTVPDSTLKVYQDKLFLTVMDRDDKPKLAYLKKSLYDSFKIEEQPFPENLYVVFVSPEDADPYFFLSTRSGKGYKSKQKSNGVPNMLPAKIGDTVILGGTSGRYLVTYVSRDVLVVTHKVWAAEYHQGKRTLPTAIFTWDQFTSRCKM